MGPVLASLIPVFLVIALGWLARATGFVADRHWAGLERVTYVIFFPALVIHTLAQADLSSVPLAGVSGALVLSILGLSALLLALRPVLAARIGLDGPGFSSLFQGCTRWNTFVALAMAGSLHGPRGVTVMAVAIAAMVPLLNALALAVLVRYARARPQTGAEIAVAFVTNPFIWSSTWRWGLCRSSPHPLSTWWAGRPWRPDCWWSEPGSTCRAWDGPGPFTSLPSR